MFPSRLILGALMLAAGPVQLAGQAAPDRSVILVTLDGVRPAEFFAGMDSTVAVDMKASGIRDSAATWNRYWRPDSAGRRRAVMPFFWDSLAPRGMVLGDPGRGSRARITNSQGFSAPGYIELLTGRAWPEVTSNQPIRYEHETVLQFARRRLRLGPSKVVVFSSWGNLRFYATTRADDVYVNAALDTVPPPYATPRLDFIAALASSVEPVWDSYRQDGFTAAAALEYFRAHRPRLLYVSLGDTDEFAHGRRYDKTLAAMGHADDFLRQLWRAVNALPEYRGRTTLIVTTDHGRGLTPENWTSHGRTTDGSERIWLAVIGPFTRATGVAPGDATQAQVAATVLSCLGLDPAGFSDGIAAEVAGACQR